VKKRLFIVALMVAALVWLPESPANKGGAFTAAAGCSTQERNACWENNGYWDFQCCACSLPAQVGACESANGYWDYCYRTCT
jgi:hypothetical protein